MYMNRNDNLETIEFTENRFYIPSRNVGVDKNGIVIRNFGDTKVFPRTIRYNTIVITNDDNYGLIDVDFCDFLPCIFDYVNTKGDIVYNGYGLMATWQPLDPHEYESANAFIEDAKQTLNSYKKHSVSYFVKRGDGTIQIVVLSPTHVDIPANIISKYQSENYKSIPKEEAFNLLQQELDKFSYNITEQDFIDQKD